MRSPRQTLTTDARRTITATEAQACLGIPASTIRAWATQGRLYAVGIGPDRQREYHLADVLALRETTQRRRRHTRPSRCARPSADIA